jgi:hypothetical protein
MGFDDRKTEPLIAVGCLSMLCGLLAPAAGRLFGWWGLLLLLPPPAVWVLLEWVWLREDRKR